MRLLQNITLLLVAVTLLLASPCIGGVLAESGSAATPDSCGPMNGGPCIIADFIGSPTTGDAPLRVQFLDASSGRPSMWAWDFGDGGTVSAVADPVHTYTKPGKYTVKLAASSLTNGTSTKVREAYIIVRDPTPISADFIGHPTNGFAPLDVQFSDCTIGNPDIWKWDFGDGSTSTIQNPNHTYQRPGKYTVTLNASTALGGTSTKVKEDYIIVDGKCSITADFSFDPQSGIAPLTVQFTDLSTGDPTMWAWDFGDGSTDMVASPSHTYEKPGTYTVRLAASSQSCGEGSKEKTITVSPCNIKADFVGSPNSGTAPLTVQFTDKSTGNPTMWHWDFGDGPIPMNADVSCSGGGCDNIANPTHTYLEPGTYTVTLTASSQYGCSDTITKQMYVVVEPACSIKADFIANPTNGSAPLTVQFTDKSTGNPTMWHWDFGDGPIPMDADVSCSGGGCDNIANPTHTYREPGTYTVTLTASNQQGCTDTISKSQFVVVVPACNIKADFIANPTNGAAPLTVQFTDKSTGNPTMWHWDFGDGPIPMDDVSCSGGGCGNIANPTHTYREPGTYTVTLTASNQQGCTDTISKSQFVVVVPACNIKADFIADPTNGAAPLTVQFTDKSTGNPTMWHWDFGDGPIPMDDVSCSGGGCGNIANPTHTYREPGTYTVTLTASNQQGCTDTISKSQFVVVVPACSIKADFIADPTNGSAPLTVQFTDKSTGNPTMWHWDFGDGPIPMDDVSCSGGGCGNIANPTHTYREPGTYTVTLTASNQQGCTDTISKSQFVVVVPACSIKADFIANPTSGSAPLTVQFTDKSTGNPTMWHWDFGDGPIPMDDVSCSGGGCGNIANPTHTYREPGTYTVTLTASNQQGCTDTISKSQFVVVVPACSIKADFIADPTSGAAPLTVQFTDKSTGNPTMWHWDFGDGPIPMDDVSCSGGSCGNIANPIHTYREPGTYTVTLTASNQQGCTDTISKSQFVVVVPACKIDANFSAAPTSGEAPLKVQFTDLSAGNPTMWKWNFGDKPGPIPMEADVSCSGGGCDNIANPIHTYLDPGTYTVTLTASNQQGCSDTETKTAFITVGKKPTDVVPLYPGWNFVSVPKKLAPGSDTASIFSHVDVKGHSVFQYDSMSHAWNIVNPGTIIRPLDAFWIYSGGIDKIPLEYDPNPVQTPPTKQLKKGWNGVGFTGVTPIEAKYTFLSVQNSWVNCVGFDGSSQRYNAMIIKGSNDNTMLGPYNGYWLYMSADGILAANAA
nr:PKD domain-containing protein [uncultured Methanospirillum sp.]